MTSRRDGPAPLPVVNAASEAVPLIVQRLNALFPEGCRRVLLVNPPESPEHDFNIDLVLARRYPCFPPYGPGILARNLERRGYPTALLDLNYHVLRHACESPERFRFRIWQDLLADKIAAFRPDIVGISVMFTITQPSMADVAAYLKALHPGLPIIAGGICVSNDVERILRAVPEVDLGSFYEADRSFPDLLDVINRRRPTSALKQVAMLVDDRFLSVKERSTPTAGEIDVAPEYYDLPVGAYTRYGSMGAYNFMRDDRHASSVLSNRGCRARCSFCAVRNFNGLSVRHRPVASVVDELQRLHETYGVSHFMWLDDDLLNTGPRSVALFNEIVKRGLSITWDASNGVIAAALKPEIVQAAAESGCVGLTLGLESGNDDVLASIHKPGRVKHYREAREILDRCPGIFVKGFTIIGFPNETMAQIRDTVRVWMELQFGWYPLQLLTPLPNTEITLSMIEQGLIGPPTDASFRGLAAGAKSGSGGALRRLELEEKAQAREFVDLLEALPDAHVPTPAELEKLWFLIDYRVNYEKIRHVDDPVKLRNIGRMLRQVTDDYTKDNALGNLFLGVIADKLGDPVEARRRVALAERFQRESAYWTARFHVLGLGDVAERVLQAAR